MMKIGLNVFESDILKQTPDCRPLLEGLDFAVCHIDCNRHSKRENLENAARIADFFDKQGMSFIANFEFQNFAFGSKGPDGYEWTEREDGTFRLNLPDTFVRALNSKGNCMGIMLDEFEHVLINDTPSFPFAFRGRSSPEVFALQQGLSVIVRSTRLTEQLTGYARELKQKGAAGVSGEHVFPVLYHTFARAGILPNFKAQKESYAPVQFALAAGAALEYQLPLRCCTDMWFMNTHPGHSAEEMANCLKFCFLAGVDEAYVESEAAMQKQGMINEIGRAFGDFVREFNKKERPYDIRDYRPEVGIIRMDDGYWGQSGILWKKMLLGDPAIRPDRKAKEYLRVFHLLTRGKTNVNGINWGRMTLWSLRRHKSFCPLNSLAVYDNFARRETLESLKICFLCGETISPETLTDVRALVRENGLTVITKKRFAPDDLKQGGRDGTGRWVVVRNFLSLKARRAAKEYLPGKDEMRLRFQDRVVLMKIARDGDSFTEITDHT